MTNRAMSTIGIVILIVFLMGFGFISSASADGEDWIIDGNTVYVDDPNAYLSATPHILTSSGWVTFEVYPKNYSGNIDVCWGFSLPTVKPTKAEYYAPYWNNWTISHSQMFENVQSFTPSSDQCDYGNVYNTYHYDVAYQIPVGFDNVTNQTVYEDTTAIVCFDSYAVTDDNYTVSWETRHSQWIEWVDVSGAFSVIKYDYGGMNTWYYKQNFPVVAGNSYKLRAWVDVPVTTEGVSGKYWWAIKPSSMSIHDAIVSDCFYALDPWYNAAWSKKQPILINNTGGGALTYYPVGDGTGKPLNITYDANMNADFSDIRVVNDTSGTTVPYWIESKFDENYCNIWFNVSAIPAGVWTNDTYYLYYGNSEASSASNGDNTFLFFDDFADGDYTADPTWTVQNGAWDASVFDLLTATQADRITALTDQAYGRWIWDFKFDSNDGDVPNSFLLQFMHDVTTTPFSNGNGYGIYINNDPRTPQFFLRRAIDGTGAVIGGDVEWGLGTDWHTIEVTRDAANEFKVYLDDVLRITVTDDNIAESTYINIDNYRADAAGGDKRADNFRFGKYASPEPSAELGDEESSYYVPGTPVNLESTTGDYWIKFTWDAGTGNVTDSYNVSWNGTWYNDTVDSYMQREVGSCNWANITVWAYNSTNLGALSLDYVSDGVQAPCPEPTPTPTPSGDDPFKIKEISTKFISRIDTIIGLVFQMLNWGLVLIVILVFFAIFAILISVLKGR